MHLGLEYLAILPNKLARLHSRARSEATLRLIMQVRKDNFVFPAFPGPQGSCVYGDPKK